MQKYCLFLYRLTYVLQGGQMTGTEWTRYIYALDEQSAHVVALDLLSTESIQSHRLESLPNGTAYQKTRIPGMIESEVALEIL